MTAPTTPYSSGRSPRWRQRRLCQPPPPPPTLWEEHRQSILAGKPLPVLAADEVERYSRVVARLQQLPPKRRQGALRIGVNRAICYGKCPRQYWFRYLLRGEAGRTANALPPIIEAPAESEDDLHARVNGTTFGLLLHGILQQVEFNEDLQPQLAALYPTVAADNGVAMSETDRAHLAACLQRLQQLPIYPDLTRASVLQRELRFLAQEGGILVPGIIDLLACTAGQWWILDYKTGRASADHLRQVAIYALGVQHALGVTPTRVCIAYLDAESPPRPPRRTGHPRPLRRRPPHHPPGRGGDFKGGLPPVSRPPVRVLPLPQCLPGRERGHPGRTITEPTLPCFFNPGKRGEPNKWVTLYAYLGILRE